VDCSPIAVAFPNTHFTKFSSYGEKPEMLYTSRSLTHQGHLPVIKVDEVAFLSSVSHDCERAGVRADLV
jgi:hypothetical protein